MRSVDGADRCAVIVVHILLGINVYRASQSLLLASGLFAEMKLEGLGVGQARFGLDGGIGYVPFQDQVAVDRFLNPGPRLLVSLLSQ